MPGLVPGIHALSRIAEQDVDGWDEPGHDGASMGSRQTWQNHSNAP